MNFQFFTWVSILIIILQANKIWPRENVLSNAIQLTFDGNRSGEGYFSSSGHLLCYQSESHSGNPFYQIYLLDLRSGSNRLVSSGIGKTTCAWIHPSEKNVLYASTHLDPNSTDKQKQEYELRNSGRNKKYSWDYDPSYDLFIKNLNSNSETRLTNNFGYDAECAFSPDGEKIVFTSNRHFYSEKLDGNVTLANNHSLSQHNEIYIMDSDGKNVRRLTNYFGYDGGPFFDSTGDYICWRRFSSDGHKAEIFRMEIDGSQKTQLTDLGAMSWAPFFHPSNEYLIFTTNLHGFQNFELYIVDFEGEKNPVRITQREGFDGLPSFSPDGRTISWTSNATPTKKSQIFLADWDHDEAMALLKKSTPKSHSKDQNNTTPKSRLRKHIEFLTSEEQGGRATGSEGMKKANEYVTKVFENNNLLPYLQDNWQQDFSFYKNATIDTSSYFKISPLSGDFQVGKDWTPLAFSESGKSSTSELSFVGYGLRLTSEKNGVEYDSYTHLDVENKWVICMRGLPSGWSKEDREKHYYESTIRKKASVARDLGAKGIIFIQSAKDTNTELIPFDSGSREKLSIQAISISNNVRDQIFLTHGKGFQKIEDEFISGKPKMGFKIKNFSLNSNIGITRHKGICQNTIGYFDLNENGKLDEPFILVGAHLDHIGRGKNSSRAKKTDVGKIHPGADDNGSGISALLEIVEFLRNNFGLIRNSKYEIAFATWSGEEIGLVGSSHFARKILGENQHTGSPPILAYLNMDMIGRMKDKMTIHGVGSSSVWRKIIQQANVPVRLNLNLQNDSHIPTDTTSFYSKGIPIISAFSGLHNDYHSPSDTEDKINYEGVFKCSSLFSRIITLLGRTENVDYIAQERPLGKNRGKLRAYLGTIPNYSQTDTKGVLLSGVSKNGPADIAGLKEGDLIVKLSEKEIENIYDYTEAISSLKPDKKVAIAVIRKNKKVTLEITPKAR